MKKYQICRSRYHIPDVLRFGKQCVVIDDSDTAETIRKKITPDIYYLIDMRTKNIVKIEDILAGKPYTQQDTEKKRRIF